MTANTPAWLAGLSVVVAEQKEAATLVESAQARTKRESVQIGLHAPALSKALKTKSWTVVKVHEATTMAKAHVEAANKVGLILIATKEKFDESAHADVMFDFWKAVKGAGQANLKADAVEAIIASKPATIQAAYDMVVAAMKAFRDAKAEQKAEKEAEEAREEMSKADNVVAMLQQIVTLIGQKSGEFDAAQVEALMASAATLYGTLSTLNVETPEMAEAV